MYLVSWWQRRVRSRELLWESLQRAIDPLATGGWSLLVMLLCIPAAIATLIAVFYTSHDLQLFFGLFTGILWTAALAFLQLAAVARSQPSTRIELQDEENIRETLEVARNAVAYMHEFQVEVRGEQEKEFSTIHALLDRVCGTIDSQGALLSRLGHVTASIPSADVAMDSLLEYLRSSREAGAD